MSKLRIFLSFFKNSMHVKKCARLKQWPCEIVKRIAHLQRCLIFQTHCKVISIWGHPTFRVQRTEKVSKGKKNAEPVVWQPASKLNSRIGNPIKQLKICEPTHLQGQLSEIKRWYVMSGAGRAVCNTWAAYQIVSLPNVANSGREGFGVGWIQGQ